MSPDTRARVVYYDLGVNKTILCARADPEPSGLCGYTNPGPGPAIRHRLRHRRANVICLTSSPSLGAGIPARCLCREESGLGFAVRRPAQGQASPRCHRMPCGDVGGRIHIRVGGVTAGGGGEDSVALAVLPRHMPARRAALASVRRVNLLDSARSFLLQAASKNAPAGGGDLPVQPGLGAHAPAGLADGASRRANHAGNPQVLDTDHVESAGQIGGELLGPVLARVRLAGSQRGDRGLDPAEAVPAAPGPDEPALEPFEPLLAAYGKAGAGEHLARGQRRADRDTPVHAHHLPGPGPLY